MSNNTTGCASAHPVTDSSSHHTHLKSDFRFSLRHLDRLNVCRCETQALVNLQMALPHASLGMGEIDMLEEVSDIAGIAP